MLPEEIMVVERLSFSYQNHPVLKEISFQMKAGQSVCLIGKNGVGKSTLFRCLLGINNPQKGQIFIHQKDIQEYSRAELSRKIAYIPQSQRSTFPFTALEMVLMGTASRLRNYQQPGKQEYQRAYEALERLHITHLQQSLFSEISGGEQQLVIIARSLAQQSSIIIMDEPCANLDFGNQIKILELIQELTRQGYLIIQSTHDPNHALQYADQVLILENGMLSVKGTPSEVLTSEVLSRIYQIPIQVKDMGDGQSYCMACQKEVSYVGNV